MSPTISPTLLADALRHRCEADTDYWLDANGTSMGRTIPGGARVRVVAGTRPRVGEIWAFCGPRGQVVVHRCVWTGGSQGNRRYRFRGDSSPGLDAPAPAEVLIGPVVEVEVDGRRRPLRRRPAVALVRGVTAHRRVHRLRRALHVAREN